MQVQGIRFSSHHAKVDFGKLSTDLFNRLLKGGADVDLVAFEPAPAKRFVVQVSDDQKKQAAEQVLAQHFFFSGPPGHKIFHYVPDPNAVPPSPSYLVVVKVAPPFSPQKN